MKFHIWAVFENLSRMFHSPTHSLTPRRYNPCRVLADSRSRLQSSLSLALALQFLTPNFSASFVTSSIHLRFGLPARLLPSGLSKVIFLHGRLSCIRITCPALLSLVILIVVTRSASSYKRYSSSLYHDENVPVSLKPGKNNGYFTWRLMHIIDNISLNSSYNEKCLRL